MTAMFYGWVIVAVGFLLQAIGPGNLYLSSAYTVPFKEAFHSSTEALVLQTTGLMMLAYGILSPICGVLARRVNLKYFAAGVFAAMAAGYVALSYATALWQVAIVYSVFFSTGYLGYVVAPTLVANWFFAKRGLAFGVMGCGYAVPGLLIVPAMTYCLAHYGLHRSFLVYGLILCLLVPVTLLLVVSRPEDRSMHPDGAPHAIDERADGNAECSGAAWTVPRLLRSGKFWITAMLVTVQPTVVQQLLIHLMPMAKSNGIALQAASLLVSTFAFTSLAGKLAIGWLADRVGVLTIVLIPLLGMAFSCVLLLFSTTYGSFLAAAALLGIAAGAGVVMVNVVIARTFGRSAFALVAGLTVPIWVALSMIATSATGRAIDLTGSYVGPIEGFIVLLLVGTALAITCSQRLWRSAASD